MTKKEDSHPTPQEWKTATDYALMLGDKMLKAEEQAEEERREPSPQSSAA